LSRKELLLIVILRLIVRTFVVAGALYWKFHTLSLLLLLRLHYFMRLLNPLRCSNFGILTKAFILIKELWGEKIEKLKLKGW